MLKPYPAIYNLYFFRGFGHAMEVLFSAVQMIIAPEIAILLNAALEVVEIVVDINDKCCLN